MRDYHIYLYNNTKTLKMLKIKTYIKFLYDELVSYSRFWHTFVAGSWMKLKHNILKCRQLVKMGIKV